MPRVTILLPTKNGSKHIRESLESVLAQKFSDWELLIIDNGSTDNTAQIIKSFTDGRIKYFSYTEKQGIQYALNFGLKQAAGEYIARIDDDDIWASEEKLGAQVEFLETHPDHVLVGTNEILIDDSGNEVRRVINPGPDKEIRASFMFRNPFAHPSVLFRKEAAVKAGGYDERYRFVQDYDFWMKLAKLGKLYNLQEFYLNWRLPLHPDPRRDYEKNKIQALIIWRHKFEFPNFFLGLIKIFSRLALLFLFKQPTKLRAAFHKFYKHLLNFDLISVLFFLAIFTLVWRQGNALLLGLPKPFELIISLIAILVALTFLSSEHDRQLARRFAKAVRPYLLPLFLLLVGLSIGHAFSAFQFEALEQYQGEILLEYIRIAFVILLFFLTIYLCLRRPKLISWILVILAISPLIFWAAANPNPNWQFFLLSSGRLRGVQNDPNYLATLISVSFLIAVGAALYINKKSRWFWLFVSAALAPLLLWTGSRAAWFSFGLTALFLVLYFLLQRHFKKILELFLLAVICLSAAIGGYFLFPRESQIVLAWRALPPLISDNSFNKVLSYLEATAPNQKWSSGASYIAKSLALTSEAGFGQSRSLLWNEGWRTFLLTPLGLGPAFYLWSPVEVIDNVKQGPHNLYLEVGLMAGYLGFIGLVIFLYRILKSAAKGRGFINTLLLVCLIYLLLNSFFLSTFTLRWLWLIMALIIANESNRSNVSN